MSPRSAKVTAIENAILEPVVPHQTIIGEIKRYWRDGQLTRQSLQRILNQLLDYAVITHKEKAALSKARLGDSMPADWYKNPEKPVYQRLELVNIKLIHDKTQIGPDIRTNQSQYKFQRMNHQDIVHSRMNKPSCAGNH